ncbi:unnamed protein product [Arctia plantaginis]|uniref:Uncharacterized protein n=1 Tax=Arctia plantaginis TaxID=874455 RepID=A0A8S1AIX6_ARCPL|nr:unnamed protein product [Arctia plantaginis]
MVSVIVLGEAAYAYRYVKQRSGRLGAETLATPVRPLSSSPVLAALAPESTRSRRARVTPCRAGSGTMTPDVEIVAPAPDSFRWIRDGLLRVQS